MTHAQDSISYRIILIGDAGEMGKEQVAELSFAANSIMKNKTTVIYLGDNIYPKGMALPGSTDTERTESILRSEYMPMRVKGAPVYFIPGNHDWDKSGLHGLEKIKQQWKYLGQQQDSLLRLVPENGCPDPYEIKINDKLAIIAFDSEWWLYPFNKTNPGVECRCKTKTDIANSLADLFYRNRDKIILLASHHPFQSYGIHGGIFSLKDHIFPLTALNQDLYIPLPGVGSLYPLFRSAFVNLEDIGHPEYQDMIKKIDGVFGGYPNLIHVAGHEHGLQFIKNNKDQLQVVSGAGAKDVYVKKGKYSLFADAIQGFVTADLMKDNSMRFTYYIYTDQGVKPAFTYTKPYVPVAALNEQHYKSPDADCVTVSIRPVYDSVGGLHRKFLGENYRKEWAAKVKLPYLKLSQLHGGLTPERRGGGLQTNSIRLIDPEGKEWVLRTVEKDPSKVLSEELQQTFAFTWLDDVTSALHPFGALVVPPIADALKIPHANPVVGVVAPDKNLEQYAGFFTNKVCLLEEREPTGKSDNTEKMEKALEDDNTNHFMGEEFIRARMLDVLLGDWDRHEDQWRWYPEKNNGTKLYSAVPRDRDDALYTRRGLAEKLAARRWLLPTLQGFDSNIGDVRYSMFKSRFMNPYPESIVSYEEWMKIANDFKATVTDSLLEAALGRMPPEMYKIRHDQLLKIFKQRRDNLPAAMDEYYRFANKIADIRLSDKNERVLIKDAANNSLSVTAVRLNKKGNPQDTLLKAVYHPTITKEVRLFAADGNDQVTIDTKNTAIKLRIVAGDGEKQYQVIESNKKVRLYGKTGNHLFTGDSTRFITHFNTDTANTAIHNTDLYNVWRPLATADINRDDGFLLGLGFQYTGQEGFRKFPYTTVQELMLTHSFTTNAFSINYKGEWIKVVGDADLILQTTVKAPNNTTNFFGLGNGSIFDKSENISYYRIRFDTYEFNPALRWNTGVGSNLSAGPSLSYFHLNPAENTGRFINNTAAIGSYDSTTVDKDKLHAGVILNYLSDQRDNKIFPTSGIYLNVKLQGYAGLNSYSRSFAQLIPEIAFYRGIGSDSRFVLAERLGGGVTIGQPAFYQSLFLGGEGNLLGYRKNRFAGRDMLYNNLEGRLKLGDLASYILPGQFGLSGFYDIGRVWANNDPSNIWHQGVGGGFYFAPADKLVLQIQAGYSVEGWYPDFSLQYRF